MSRNKNYPDRKQEESQSESQQEETVQNSAPQLAWPSFDAFWTVCVKNGTPTIKEACIAHLKAIDSWNDSNKWIDGLLHFGVPVEK